MKKLIVLSHSGYGHTQKLAEAVVAGAQLVQGLEVEHLIISQEGTISDEGWEALAGAQGIIFGCPTYMGGPSWQFKRIADASSKPWFANVWKDKLAAGFTNSASINGDKFSTIQYLITLSMQHGMLWVGTGMKASNSLAAERNDPNWLGGFSGLLGQSPADSSPDQGPLPGDLRTASLFGERVGQTLLRIV